MPPRIDRLRVEQALKLRQEGKTQQEIASQLGVELRMIQYYHSPKWLIERGLHDLAETYLGLSPHTNPPPKWTLTWLFTLPRKWLWGSLAALAIILVLSVILNVSLDNRFSDGIGGVGTGLPSSAVTPPASSFSVASSLSELDLPPVELALTDRVAVTAAGNGIKVFTEPSTESPLVKSSGIAAGFEGEIVEGPRISDGRRWWRVKWVANVTGWSRETSANGISWFQPLPGKGVFQDVTDVGLSYRVEVYKDVGPEGLPVRDAPGDDQPIKLRLAPGARGWTLGSPKVIGDFVWWKIKWEDSNGISGWSKDSDIPTGVYLLKRASVGYEHVTLTLYVHELHLTDPVVVGARVTGRDAADESFDRVTNSKGFVTITGTPGIWYFTISAPGFENLSWDQRIASSSIKRAFFAKLKE